MAGWRPSARRGRASRDESGTSGNESGTSGNESGTSGNDSGNSGVDPLPSVADPPLSTDGPLPSLGDALPSADDPPAPREPSPAPQEPPLAPQEAPPGPQEPPAASLAVENGSEGVKNVVWAVHGPTSRTGADVPYHRLFFERFAGVRAWGSVKSPAETQSLPLVSTSHPAFLSLVANSWRLAYSLVMWTT